MRAHFMLAQVGNVLRISHFQMTILISSLSLLGCMVPIQSVEPERTKIDTGKLELKALLESNGYKRLPLTRDRLGSLHLKLRLGNKDCHAKIDTGADTTIFSESLAEELKLDLKAEAKSSENIGGPVMMKYSRVAKSVAKGDFTFAHPVLVCKDFRQKIFAADLEKASIDMLIGMDVLRYHSAIINCGEPALYIREPDATNKDLDGNWQEIAQTREGILMDKEASQGTTLKIHQDTMTYRNGKRSRDFKLTLHDNFREPKAMDWEEKGPGSLPVIYTLNGDTLQICGNFTNSKAVYRPDEFKSTKSNGYSVATFSRIPVQEEENKPKVAVNVPTKKSPLIELEEFLKQGGFERNKLKREPLGTLYLTFPLGETKQTVLIDTGASSTFLSGRLAKDLKLTLSEKSQTVACIGGSVEMKTAKIPKSITPKIFSFPNDVFVSENNTEKIMAKVIVTNVDIEMILGMDVLRNASAVIDTASATIYFRKE